MPKTKLTVTTVMDEVNTWTWEDKLELFKSIRALIETEKQVKEAELKSYQEVNGDKK